MQNIERGRPWKDIYGNISVTRNDSKLMMANYEIVEFIAVMQSLIEKFTIFFLKATGRWFQQTENNKIWVTFFCTSKLKGFEF